MYKNPLVYVSVDTPDLKKALYFAEIVADAAQGLKLGLEFFNANGPQGVASVRNKFPSLSFFLDLKYHDIPNTVEAAVHEASKLNVDYINVHASGGAEMMKRALRGAEEGAAKAGVRVPKVIAVTVLTSLDATDLSLMGIINNPSEQVLRLAALTKEAGLAGVVCSAHEISVLRRSLGNDFVLMVPGIRPAGSESGDQKRVMTPRDALMAGATNLVIGRPVIAAADPRQALHDIIASCL
jgi:orotidine-5'-phosphate decarboxylase